MPGGRELTIYAVDVSPSMGELMTVDDPSTGTTKSVTKLEYGLEVIKHQVANMLLAGLKTAHCGIVLFGTNHTQNSLAASGFLSTIILCNHLMGETLAAKKWTRKLLIVTDGRTQTDWNGWKDQRDKMRMDGVTLDVVGIDFDDPELGFLEANKPEIKAANELKLGKLCSGLENSSACWTALVAVINAQSPQSRVTGSSATPLMLTLGYPDSETAKGEGFDPQETLFIRCEMQKCTMVTRPMSSKKMSRFGISSELERRRKDLALMQSGRDPQQEDQDDDALKGLLQTNRKFVYVSKQAKEGPRNVAGDESDDTDMNHSSDDEPAPLQDREADQETLAKAYKYGTSLVIVNKEDEARIRQPFSPCMEIRGFTLLRNIPRHHLLNNVYYLSPITSDAGSQLTFSALVRAMHDAKRAALVRYISRAITAEPKMAILIPVVEPTMRYFLFVQVPFAEDLREYYFPCLPSAGSQPRRKVNSQHVPTEDMQEAMDDLVDKMDLAAEEEATTSDGRTQPWLELEDACSPAVHHVKNCVLHRLSHPDSQGLAPVHPALAKCTAPPPHVAERAASSLERVIQLMDVKAVPSLSKPKRRHAPLAPRDGDEKIKLDNILGEV
ncbi:hypothetical protein VP01_5g9 [Puccinia sorghi]|uniref:ATP-dependent DNA helicase II subunit 2 n=1 Tax=Puccinia sorghi TaxID=27349 RepID=A0A0L6UI87_9BASI|nr:hypothetical protein VP01_5g9 [Puccinia sorghi]